MQQCLKEMIQVPQPGRPSPCAVPELVTWGQAESSLALLCLACELFWVSEEEEMEQSEWHGFDWCLVGSRDLLFS